MFVTSTLAVRTVILRVRAGGNERATTITRRSVFAVTATAAGGLAWLAAAQAVPVVAVSVLTSVIVVATV